MYIKYYMDIDLKSLISIISTSIGLISALLSKLYFDKLKKLEDNKDKLRLQTDITNIENKLKTFYIPIYFKLLIISITKKQIKYLKKKNINEYLKIEKNVILNTHEEIINIILSCYSLDTINDISIDIIKDYINYVVIYRNIRNINYININITDDICGKYPKNFLIEIENKITELHEKYESFLGRNNSNISYYKKIITSFNKCLSFFRFFNKSKKNNINKSNTISNNKWSISNYIKNNINISEINKILYDETSSIESIYNNINLEKIFEKINKQNGCGIIDDILLEINMTDSIPLEYIDIKIKSS